MPPEVCVLYAAAAVARHVRARANPCPYRRFSAARRSPSSSTPSRPRPTWRCSARAPSSPRPTTTSCTSPSSFLHGRLDQGGDPPGTNDWACYDTVELSSCPNGIFQFAETERYRWYVSFPPFPAVVILPAVAVFGVALPDRLFWALFAGLGPASVYVLLRFFRERGSGERAATISCSRRSSRSAPSSSSSRCRAPCGSRRTS